MGIERARQQIDRQADIIWQLVVCNLLLVALCVGLAGRCFVLKKDLAEAEAIAAEREQPVVEVHEEIEEQHSELTIAVQRDSEAAVTVQEILEAEPAYSAQELETLAIIIYQEAGGDACSDATRQMVGEVFLNRVASDRYPDTFEEVATQRKQYGRLHWTGIQWPERASKTGEKHAVQRAYDTAEALLEGTTERLLPTDAVYQAEFSQGTEILAMSDNMYFCK